MESRKTGRRITAPPSERGTRPSRVSKLKTYQSKRNFKRTVEPSGAVVRSKAAGLTYVIQKHQASHLHYDLRLEQDGVLKSWAIPKEPSPRLGEKRLAVEVEDHPLDYASFEGRIPSGEYGAGTVKVWDRGTYEPLETGPTARIVNLRGRRLKGTFALIRLRSKPGDKHNNWLFFKMKDDGSKIRKRKSA